MDCICYAKTCKNMQGNMQNMHKSIFCNMQNIYKSIFCIFCIYILSQLCSCWHLLANQRRASGGPRISLIEMWLAGLSDANLTESTERQQVSLESWPCSQVPYFLSYVCLRNTSFISLVVLLYPWHILVITKLKKDKPGIYRSVPNLKKICQTSKRCTRYIPSVSFLVRNCILLSYTLHISKYGGPRRPQ